MKTRGLFLTVCSALIVAAALALAGCDDLFMTEFTFKNDSSYTVSVSPSGHDDFTLNPGNSLSIKDKSSSLPFLYAPAEKVKVKMEEKNTVRFLKRI